MAKHTLSVKYRRQIKKGHGGAASCRMVLESPPINRQYPQATLYNEIKKKSSAPWTAGPNGVRWTMNNYKGPFGGYFVIYDLAFDAIARKLVWTIVHYKVAPIVLVYNSPPKWGAQHWMVVKGCEIKGQPNSADDRGYIIQKFLLLNPWPGIDEKHLGMSKPTWVSRDEFQTTYLAMLKGGVWNNKYVAVCDPDPPAEERGEVEPVEHRLPGDRIINPDEAMSIAREELELQRPLLEEWPDLYEAELGMPRLVQRLDLVDTYYYIVPVGDRAAVRIDALYGDGEGIVVPEGDDSAFRPVEREQLFEELAGRDLGTEGELLQLRLETMCICPTLVWRPCRESLDPMVPFYMLNVGDRRFYVRIDGEVFSALHDDNAGI